MSIFRNVSEVQPPEDLIHLPGDIGLLMGGLERNKCAITIEGDQGAGKSRFVFDLANAFAAVSMKVGVFSLEMAANSSTVKKYLEEYIDGHCAANVQITDKLPDGMNTIRQAASIFDVIVIDSFGKATQNNGELDKLRNEFPQTIWIPIFQRTTSGEIRGGTKAIFDASTNCEVIKVDEHFVNNYACCTKNRYGPTGLRYNIYDKTINIAQ